MAISLNSGIEITEFVGVASAGITTEASSTASFSATGARDEGGADATEEAEPCRGLGLTGSPFDNPPDCRFSVRRLNGLTLWPPAGLPTGE